MDERDERRVLGRYRRRDGPADAAHGHVDDGGGQGPPGVSSDHRGGRRELERDTSAISPANDLPAHNDEDGR